MTIVDKFKIMVKTPLFWAILSMVMLTSIILVIYFMKKEQNCLAGEMRYKSCDGVCGPICKNTEAINCTTMRCDSCPDGTANWGGVRCCGNSKTSGGKNEKTEFCCSKNQQCPTDDNASACCPTGQICKKGACVKVCGTDAKTKTELTCDESEICIESVNISSLAYGKFANDFENTVLDKYNNAYACGKSQACKRTPTTSFPAQINNFSPCSTLFNSKKNGNIGYCWPNDDSKTDDDINTCYTDTNCASNKCKFINALDVKEKTHQQNMQALNKKAKSTYYGNWCGKQTQNILEYTTKKCKDQGIETCWQVLGGVSGVSDIKWNNDTNMCSVIVDCIDGSPPNYKSDCSTSEPPDLGKDGYVANSTGTITKSVADACTHVNTCEQALKNGKAFWCINETGIGTCEIGNSNKCPDNKSVFVNNLANCPGVCDNNNIITKNNNQLVCGEAVNQYSIDRGSCGADFSNSLYVIENRLNKELWVRIHNLPGGFCGGNDNSGIYCTPTIKIQPFQSSGIWDGGHENGALLNNIVYPPQNCLRTLSINEIPSENDSVSIIVNNNNGTYKFAPEGVIISGHSDKFKVEIAKKPVNWGYSGKSSDQFAVKLVVSPGTTHQD